MVEPFLSDITPVITTVVLVGGMLFGAVRWLIQQQEKKAVRVKEEATETANELKKLTEDAARDVKLSFDNTNKDLLIKIVGVDTKLSDVNSELRKRVDLTNGNVAFIRTDIADLQEDIQAILDDKDDALDDDDELKRSKRRQQERTRRQKRRKIEADRVSQSERRLNDYGHDN